MKCKYCGAELKPEDKFCTECGAKVEITRTCPKCGAETTGKYCIECGYDLDTQPTSTNVPPVFSQEATPAPEPVQPQTQANYGGVYMDTPKKSNKGLIGIVVGLAILVVVGIGATAMLSSKKTSSNEVEVIKEEVRTEKDDKKDDGKNDTQVVKKTSSEDMFLVDTLDGTSTVNDLQKQIEKLGTKNSDNEYEIDGVINGKDVTYYCSFNESDELEVTLYYIADGSKDYESMKNYILDYLKANYERDPYNVEEGDDEYIYENDIDFIMVFTYDDENSLFVYRSPYMS